MSANSKITQYELLESPAADDLLLVVDVHDESMGPTGTDKKSLVGSLPFLSTGQGGALLSAIAPGVVALAQASGLVPLNAAPGNDFRLTLTASGWTIESPANPVNGQDITVSLVQDGTGGRTVNWGEAWDFGAGAPPVLSQLPNSVDVIAFKYFASISSWVFLGSNVPVGPWPLSQGGTGVSVSTDAALLIALGAMSAAGGSLTGPLGPSVITLADAPTVTIDASLGNVFEWPLGGAEHTLAIPLNALPGQAVTIDVQQPESGGPFTPLFTTGAGGYTFGSGGAPSWSTAAGAVDTIGFRYSQLLGKWLCSGWKTGFS